MENIVIRKITSDEVESAMSLAMEVFMQFEAPDYAPEGVETFKRDLVENLEFLEKARQGIFLYIDKRINNYGLERTTL